MKADIKTRWVTALKSGDYPQGFGYLSVYDRDSETNTYCCLGVLCELAVADGFVVKSSISDVRLYDDDDCSLPFAVVDWAGLHEINPRVLVDGDESDADGKAHLSEINDSHDYSFTKIADLIEQHL